MVFCLLAGIVFWYMVRVAVIGRWRDFIKMLPFLFLLPSQAVYAQQFVPSSNQTQGSLGIYAHGPDQLANHTIYFYTQTTSTGATAATNAQFAIVGGTAQVWFYLQENQGGSGPWKSATLTFTELASGTVRCVATGAIEGTVYKMSTRHQATSLETLTLAADDPSADPGHFRIVDSGEDFSVHVGYVYAGGSAGEGGGDPLPGVDLEKDPERDAVILFDAGVLVDTEDVENVGLVEGLPAFFDNEDLLDAASVYELPMDLPTLVAQTPLDLHINALMADLIGERWTSSDPQGTDGRLLLLFGVSNWSSLVTLLVQRVELVRTGDYAILFQMLRWCGTVLLAFYMYRMLTRYFVKAFGVVHPVIFGD